MTHDQEQPRERVQGRAVRPPERQLNGLGSLAGFDTKRHECMRRRQPFRDPHHARAAALLRTRRADDYRAEVAACHPDVSPDLAELAVAGFDTHLVLFGPGSLMASATRGYPKVGDEAFPGHLGYNKQLKTFMDEGGHVYACRFSAAALYGMRETDMMEGVKPINPLDVLDSVLTARRQGALIMQTWTV